MSSSFFPLLDELVDFTGDPIARVGHCLARKRDIFAHYTDFNVSV